ncbi:MULTISPECIES: CHAT domain-containing protein [unclassified Streptomyces]|uniref:CHAT domain-containing protein n=1 Tax=Streptomyces sp. NPDC127129 TaxID=3345373 RepID=UPI00362B629E
MSEELDDRIAAAAEWEALLGEIRSVERLEDFLRPLRIEALRPTAEGPVVMLNVGRKRCDALAVSDDGVRALELPGLTRAEVEREALAYLRTVQGFERAQAEVSSLRRRLLEGVPAPEDLHTYQDAQQALAELRLVTEAKLQGTLGWLWDRIAGPVLAHLRPVARPDGTLPRLWWCPTGQLALLPLHAAGHHGEPGRSVLDTVVSSYTPSLRALQHARQRGAPDGGRMLVVAMPQTPGQAPLPNVAAEQALLTSLFGEDRCTVLGESDAATERVLAELRTHQYVHFSCHGTQNLNEPSRAGLLLADGMLSVTDLLAGPLETDLAFLSACKTATGGVWLSDEMITLAAALHHAGCRHVIATLWSVYDPAAAFVSDHVYRQLRRDGGLDTDAAARALHSALVRLRNRRPDRPSVWIPFTHTGP